MSAITLLQLLTVACLFLQLWLHARSQKKMRDALLELAELDPETQRQVLKLLAQNLRGQ